MYNFVRALAVEPGPNKRWAEVDISTVPTSTLFTKYREIYAVLTNTALQEEMTLNLKDVMAQLQVNTGTISDYLTANGNKTLPHVVGIPQIQRANAVFRDLFDAGFLADSVDYRIGADVPVAQEDRPDVKVWPADTPDGYDYLSFQSKIIPNVNGFYHRGAADSKGFYILDGNKSRLKSKMNYLGLLSFGTFGTIDTHSITEDHLAFETNADTGLVDKVHIKFDDDIMTTKTPILFLGGYMILVDSLNLLMTASNILTLKLNRYPFAERYFESVDYLDFGDWAPPSQGNNKDFVMLSDFRKEAFLRKYFTMSQSFLGVLESQNLVMDKSYPEKQTVPHTYMHWSGQHEMPKWPLVVGEGKHEVYKTQYEANSWVIRCNDTYKRNYMFQTTASGDLLGIDRALYMGQAGDYGPAFFLKLMDERIVITAT